MVHLTRIYTKTGDDGKTSTATNERIDKGSDFN
jgi:cob(I)alamin adenosyltransferase